MLLVARLGGHLGRTHDPPPGHQIIWKGLAKLRDLCEGYELHAEELASRRGYG